MDKDHWNHHMNRPVDPSTHWYGRWRKMYMVATLTSVYAAMDVHNEIGDC